VQVVLQYNIHEIKLKEMMKESLEWELSDGHEYFYPNVASEYAKKWIINHFEIIDPNLPPFFGSREDVISYLGKEENLMYLKDQENRAMKRMWENLVTFKKTNELSQKTENKETLMTTYICEETTMNCDVCGTHFEKNSQLYNHRGYYKGTCLERIQTKRQKIDEKHQNKRHKQEAQQYISTMDPTEIVDQMNEASKTNELLEKIIEQNNDLKVEVAEIRHENREIKKQNEEMKEMVTEFARNPQLTGAG
jgi:DNA repair exonuclease SbcCD ATPase subunit